MNKTETIWVARGGPKGEADNLYLKHNLIALGPEELGDLADLDATREAFKDKYRRHFPDASNVAVGGIAGQLFRLAHEAKNGDLVIYPSKKDKFFHVGRISAAYRFDPRWEERFPHRRKVKWICKFRRGDLSVAAQNESGAFRSFFQIKSNVAEIVRLVEALSDTNPVG